MGMRLATAFRVGLTAVAGAVMAAAPAHAERPITLSYPYLDAAARKKMPGLRALAERASQSYVHVVIIYPGDPTGDDDPPGILQQASGIIIDARGYVITAAHIARSTKNHARVVTRRGSRHRARILFIDRREDLALMRIAPFAGMTPARFAESGRVKRGDFALAVGSPSRARGAVSFGFVRMPRLKESLEYNRWRIENAIEIGMEVESGHSGGPVFNRRGGLIGMVAGYELGDTTKRPYVSPQITYVIPSSGLRAFLARAGVR
ncbi:MAG: serine protease [Alphaproteobacteria bacterium]|nr:serine protease [Alphaproteobacteria bacterium]